MSARKRKQQLTTLTEFNPYVNEPAIKESTNKENVGKCKRNDPCSDSDDDDIWLSLKAKGVKVTNRHERKTTKTVSRKQLFSEEGDFDNVKKPLCKRKRLSSCKMETAAANSSANDRCPKEIEKADVNVAHHTPIKLFEKLKASKPLKENLVLHESDTAGHERIHPYQLQSNSNAIDSTMQVNVFSKCNEPASLEVTPQKNAAVLKKEKLSFVERTPSRKSYRCTTPKTPLENARTSLHVSLVPNSLPCRDEEYQNIMNFVKHKILDCVGGCMYISGVPGTGKTATVTQVVTHLQKAASKGELPLFNLIDINGMRLSDPRQAYVLLYQKIFNLKDRVSADYAHKKLETYFSKADNKKITTVVVVDELDLMCTRKQEVVYNLLEWPYKSNSRLVVLTIANTMDMPERKLKGKINSRLGLSRLTFLPYTHKQLEEIVLDRLQGNEAFVLDAVRLATRKVAAVSGDARRALDICRRAAELPSRNEPVRIIHIEMAIKEMTNSNIACHIRGCSKMEKVFLRSVCDAYMRTGVDEVILADVASQMLTVCVLEGHSAPTMPVILEICQRLRCSRLLFTNNHRAGLLQRLTLNVSQDDLYYGLKDGD